MRNCPQLNWMTRTIMFSVPTSPHFFKKNKNKPHHTFQNHFEVLSSSKDKTAGTLICITSQREISTWQELEFNDPFHNAPLCDKG